MRLFKFSILLSAILTIFSSPQLARGQALKNPNYTNGVQTAGKPIYPYTHAFFVSLNDSIEYPCGFNGTPTDQFGYSFFALPTGGDVDATCYQQPFNITYDTFSPYTKPILIWLPDVPITVTANVTIGSNYMLCYGPGSSIAAAVGYTLINNSQTCLGGGGGGKGFPVNWYVNTTLIGTEPGGDFDQGANATITGVDDPTNKQVHITVNASAQGCATSSGVVPDSTFCAGPPYSTSPLSPAVLDFISAVYAGGGSTTQSLTLGLPVSVGDTILVPIACGSNQSGLGCPYMGTNPPTVTDSQHNTYTVLTNSGGTFNAGYTGVEIGVATASAAGALTVTVTNAGTQPYDAIAVYRVSNLGTFEGFSGNQVGLPTPTLVTDTYTTLHSGDFLLGMGTVQANNSASNIYQNSSDWLTLDSGKRFFNSPFYDWYAWSASYQGSTGARSLSYSLYPSAPGLYTQSVAMIFAWQPAVYPPPGNGPPTFRLQVPTDPPSAVYASKLNVAPQTYYALPLCSSTIEGQIGAVDDALINIPGAILSAGGGTDHVEAYCDGTNWVVAAATYTALAIRVPALGMYYPGVLASSAIVGQIIAPYSITFASGMTGSVCRAAEGATASTVITIYDIPAGSSTPASFATCTFAATGSAYQTGTMTSSAAKTVAAGDIVQAIGPGTADVTLGDVSITLLGNP